MERNGTKVGRVNKTFRFMGETGGRSREGSFIDLNDITAGKYEKFGRDKVGIICSIPR